MKKSFLLFYLLLALSASNRAFADGVSLSIGGGSDGSARPEQASPPNPAGNPAQAAEPEQAHEPAQANTPEQASPPEQAQRGYEGSDVTPTITQPGSDQPANPPI